MDPARHDQGGRVVQVIHPHKDVSQVGGRGPLEGFEPGDPGLFTHGDFDVEDTGDTDPDRSGNAVSITGRKFTTGALSLVGQQVEFPSRHPVGEREGHMPVGLGYDTNGWLIVHSR